MKKLFLPVLSCLFVGAILGACNTSSSKKETGNESVTASDTVDTNVLVTDSVATLADKSSAENFVITSHSVGNLKVGMSMDKLKELIPASLTVKKETKMMEGDPYPVCNVYDKNTLLFTAELGGDQVVRFFVYGKDIKTEKGIGVNSTYAELKAAYKVEISQEEGLFALTKDPSLAFSFDSDKLPEGFWEKSDLKHLPDNLTFKNIIVD